MAATLKITTTTWRKGRADIARVRHPVFIEEQAIPPELEWDEADQTAVHVVGYLGDTPVGCLRLTAGGQLGRLAVLAGYRKKGYGSELVKYAIEKTGAEVKFLNAQAHTIPFYENLGFKAVGAVFYEAGIEHRRMERAG